MIRNRRQYGVTKAHAETFRKAIEDAKTRDVPEGTQPLMWKSYIEGMESQLETLVEEIAAYERTGSLAKA